MTHFKISSRTPAPVASVVRWFFAAPQSLFARVRGPHSAFSPHLTLAVWLVRLFEAATQAATAARACFPFCSHSLPYLLHLAILLLFVKSHARLLFECLL